MPHLSDRLAMLESASAKPKTGLMKTHLTGDAFKAKMAEGKARAKAKREAEASAPKPEAPHSPEPQAQPQHSPEQDMAHAEHGSCPTCGSGVAKESLKKRKAGLQRKAQMAKEIADQASSHADLIED